MDLQEPTKKMSTTGGTPQGTILLLDPPDVIRKKVKSAVTDSGSRGAPRADDKPGVTNLIDIMTVADRRGRAIEDRYDGGGYGAVQGRRRRGRDRAVRADPGAATTSSATTPPSSRGCLRVGADKARDAAAPTLAQMYERMGFVRP